MVWIFNNVIGGGKEENFNSLYGNESKKSEKTEEKKHYFD